MKKSITKPQGMTETYYKTLNPTHMNNIQFRKKPKDLHTQKKSKILKKYISSTMITEVYTDLDLRTILKFPTLIFVGVWGCIPNL